MIYVKVRWLHDDPADPVLFLSELDADRYETRKVEVFANGRTTFASDTLARGDTMLGEKPWPSAEEFESSPEFEWMDTDADEFERAWSSALRGATKD